MLPRSQFSIPIFCRRILLGAILGKMTAGQVDPKSLENLGEALNKILVSTKVPVKYLVASQVLKVTEQSKGWKDKEPDTIEMLSRVLHTIVSSLEEGKGDLLANNQSDNLETFQDLSYKALKIFSPGAYKYSLATSH